jgi:dTDP-4-amino-4,6-dideoxygalactose transaminase
MRIPISKPLFGPEEMAAVQRPLESAWVVQGPFVAEFERKFATFTGAKHALATSSCTTALHAALVALGVGPGDEVIVPAFTWVATANVAEMVGATPVLVDVDLTTCNVDVDRMAAAITPRTKALLPVSLFGLSAPIDPIREIARTHQLKVVEDAACAIGAFYHGHHAGTLVDAGCFSFHPRKAITTGEGGMVTTNDDAVAARIRALRDHGASTSDLVRHHGAQPYLLPEFDMLGFNYRLTDIQGAVGSAQMDRLSSVLHQRTRLALRYSEKLAGLEWLRPPVVPDGYRHGYQAYVCLFRPETPTRRNVEALHAQRNQLMKELEAAGVATRPGTHAVHMLGYYSRKYGYERESMPNAWFLDQLTLTLPLYAQMTDVEQDYVIEQLVTIGRKSLVRL